LSAPKEKKSACKLLGGGPEDCWITAWKGQSWTRD